MSIRNAILAALPGVGLAGYGTYQFGKARAESLNEMTNDLVDAVAITKKHAPDIHVATSKNEIDKIDASNIEKKILLSAMKFIEKGENAAYTPIGNGIILSPKKINRSLIGHEMGHHFDIKKNPIKVPPVLKTGMEERGWAASPFQDDESKRISKIMLGTYKGADKIAIGATAATFGAFMPKLLKVLKRK